MSEKQGLPVGNSFHSNNPTGSPKGHIRSLLVFLSSFEVTRTAPSPSPKGFSQFFVSMLASGNFLNKQMIIKKGVALKASILWTPFPAAPVLARLFYSVIFLLCITQEAVRGLEGAVSGGERQSCDFEGI